MHVLPLKFALSFIWYILYSGGYASIKMKESQQLFKILKAFIVIFLFQRSDAAPCLHICLTWKVQGNRLVLICKVDAWNLPISFFNPLKNETGFCMPYQTTCNPLSPDTVMTKNITSQEIVLTVPLDRPHNGWWTCRYGANNEIALTEVTLHNNSQNDNKHNKESDIDCMVLMMLWSVFGFGTSYLSVRFIIMLCACYWDDIGWKKVIVFLLGITLFLLPVVVGIAESNQCKDAKIFSCQGVIVGILCCLLLINKDHYEQVQNGDPTGNG